MRESAATYFVLRGGVPVAEIGPVKTRTFTARDFAALVESLPATDGAFARAVHDGRAREPASRAEMAVGTLIIESNPSSLIVGKVWRWPRGQQAAEVGVRGHQNSIIGRCPLENLLVV